MSGPYVSDHALLRFVERAGDGMLRRFLGAAADLEPEALRSRLSAALAVAHRAAQSIGGGYYLIKAGGLLFVVRNETVTTVLNDTGIGASARALGPCAAQTLEHAAQ